MEIQHLLFAGGPGTFNTDLLSMELLLIGLFLFFAYAGRGWKWLKQSRLFHLRHHHETPE